MRGKESLWTSRNSRFCGEAMPYRRILTMARSPVVTGSQYGMDSRSTVTTSRLKPKQVALAQYCTALQSAFQTAEADAQDGPAHFALPPMQIESPSGKLNLNSNRVALSGFLPASFPKKISECPITIADIGCMASIHGWTSFQRASFLFTAHSLRSFVSYCPKSSQKKATVAEEPSAVCLQ